MSKKTTEEKRATDSPSLSFEEAHSRLEELLESVHRETLSLDDSILLLRRGRQAPLLLPEKITRSRAKNRKIDQKSQRRGNRVRE